MKRLILEGISLIRAAAKNYKDIVVVPSQGEYQFLLNLLKEKQGLTDLQDRKELARQAFKFLLTTMLLIFNYFAQDSDDHTFKQSEHQAQVLRYGENPHQQGIFYGDLEAQFEKLNGKALSYNNLVDIDAAVGLMREFIDADPTFAVLKHTNSCGIATRSTVLEAWQAALAGDNISAFGGF